jgi:hypothetical protein
MKFFWQRSSKDKIKELPPEHLTNLGKMLAVVQSYIDEGMVQGSYIIIAESTLRHFRQMRRHFVEPYFFKHEWVNENTRYGMHSIMPESVTLTIIFNNSLADSIVDVVSSDQRRTTIEFRDEPPPPNTNSSTMTFWK